MTRTDKLQHLATAVHNAAVNTPGPLADDLHTAAAVLAKLPDLLDAGDLTCRYTEQNLRRVWNASVSALVDALWDVSER